jgi:hypothetical protein
MATWSHGNTNPVLNKLLATSPLLNIKIWQNGKIVASKCYLHYNQKVLLKYHRNPFFLQAHKVITIVEQVSTFKHTTNSY